MFLEFAQVSGAITSAERETPHGRCASAMPEVSMRRAKYRESTDPALRSARRGCGPRGIAS
jgi:hypothetical protein